MKAMHCVDSFLFVLSFSSGPTWPAEVALQHQPSAAESMSANEGGGWRGCEGQRPKISARLS